MTHRSLPIAVALVYFVLCCASGRAQAELIARYSAGTGSFAFAPEHFLWGWGAWDIFGPADPQGRSVIDTVGGTAPAWQVTDDELGGTAPSYFQGWSMTANMRLVDQHQGPPSLGLGVYFDAAAYLLMVDRDPASAALRAHLLDRNTTTNNTLVFELASGAASLEYHDYELRWSPATQLTSLYFDGGLVATWDGVFTNHGSDGNFFQFGSNTASGYGVMNYRSVAFQTIQSPSRQGDYNGDGVVDAADYAIWRDNRGTSFAAADGNGDGLVNQQDYVVWRQNFGRVTVASLAESPQQVPEPTTLGLAWLAIALVAARGWQKLPKLS
jgi:hypothetical protein